MHYLPVSAVTHLLPGVMNQNINLKRKSLVTWRVPQGRKSIKGQNNYS